MALPTDRNSLVRWCLSKLGAPVIDIDLDEQQIEDRVDEALDLFKEYHIDGTGRFYKAFCVTGSTLVLTAPPSQDFNYHEIFEGATSGVRGRYESFNPDDNTLTFTYIDRTDPITEFTPGEVINGLVTAATATIAAGPASVVLGMMDKKYIDLPDKVVGIIDILKTRSTFGSHPINPFDLQYQLAQNVTIQTFLNADVVTYYLFQHDIALWDQIFVGVPFHWHSRKQNRLYIDTAWTEEYRVGDYVVIQFWGAIDPEEFPKIYSDKWLRKYLTALLERQWGENLTKYVNVKLAGGIELNGQEIYNRGVKNVEEAELELRSSYEHKTGFKIG